MASETAIVAGGCFWCTEAVFENVKGVQRVESGYIGGHLANPSYQQVCSGRTGHAEAVRITYDPAVLSYRELLGLFFATHDPTTKDRQGGDVGTQYRSAVFYQDEAQRAQAETAIAELNAAGIFDAPIVTTLERASTFYTAEDYHQHYYASNPAQPYCAAVITPKVAKFRKQYAHLLAS